MISTDTITDVDALAQLHGDWDALAVELGKPFCGPAWMLSWWHYVAPRKSRLRVIVVRDGDALVGIAPFFACIRGGVVRYRLLAGPTSARIEPLVRRRYEQEVGDVFARTLARTSPKPDVILFDGTERKLRWPARLADSWPDGRRPWVSRDTRMPAPTLVMRNMSFSEWWETRSSHFRREIRRRRRRLEEAGAVFSMAADPEDLDRRLASFAALHYERWRWRGGSMALNPQMELMLRAAGRELLSDQRFRLWNIEVGEKVISSQLFVEAGGELAYWLGGFDDAWAAHGPSIQAVLAAIEHAWERGDRRIDFGAGGQSYKYSFADGHDEIEWAAVAPRGLRYPITRLQLLPGHVRRLVMTDLIGRIPQGTKDRIKRTLRRARS
jgi:CelD/BcsL family acetyltransferase involved in cellulose biosynthesis